MFFVYKNIKWLPDSLSSLIMIPLFCDESAIHPRTTDGCNITLKLVVEFTVTVTDAGVGSKSPPGVVHDDPAVAVSHVAFELSFNPCISPSVQFLVNL
jgi:hypothetical protein